MNPFAELEQFGDQIAVVLADGQTESYRGLAQQADSLCADLRETDLAAIECDNSWTSLLAYIGCLRKGYPVLLVDAALHLDLRQKLYEHYWISVVSSAESGEWQRRRTHGPEMNADNALLLSTSGTTGSPKLVRLSLANLTNNARTICNYLRLSAESSAITSLPQHYSFGLSIINSHLLAGGRLALTNAAVTERRFWDHFEKAEVDSLSGVPSTFDMLHAIRFERLPLPSLKTITQAGGRLSETLVRTFSDLAIKNGWKFFVMYGQTEATARMSYLSPDDVARYPTSVGRPIPGGRFELMDECQRPILEPFVAGELVYHGPNVMLGYAESVEDLARGDDMMGRLATGDIAERDDSGYFYIRGRKKRFIKILGNRIGLDEVEMQLAERNCPILATGRDDFLLLASTDAVSLEKAASTVVEMYGLRASMIGKLLLPELPLLSTGKVHYAELLSGFERKDVQR